MAKAKTHTFEFPGRVLERGFWLYVWEITPPRGVKLYYVGRTGDSSSRNAQSPFNRMGQHLGHLKNTNMLRRHLEDQRPAVAPEDCRFRLVSFGPIYPEATGEEGHRRSRDLVAALEKKLQEAMDEAGYQVLNTVNCRKPLHPQLWKRVRAVFGAHFPRLVAGGAD